LESDVEGSPAKVQGVTSLETDGFEYMASRGGGFLDTANARGGNGTLPGGGGCG